VTTYAEFLARKRATHGEAGFECEPSDMLYDFQREIVQFSTRKGRAASSPSAGSGRHRCSWSGRAR